MNQLAFLYKNDTAIIDAFKNCFHKVFFPFTLSQIKYRDISNDVLLKYEISTNRLAKKLDETIKLLASKEKKEANLEFQLKILEEIKKSI